MSKTWQWVIVKGQVLKHNLTNKNRRADMGSEKDKQVFTSIVKLAIHTDFIQLKIMNECKMLHTQNMCSLKSKKLHQPVARRQYCDFHYPRVTAKHVCPSAFQDIDRSNQGIFNPIIQES